MPTTQCGCSDPGNAERVHLPDTVETLESALDLLSLPSDVLELTLGPDECIGEWADDSRSDILADLRGQVCNPDTALWVEDDLIERWRENWQPTCYHCGNDGASQCDTCEDYACGQCVCSCLESGAEDREESGEILRFRYYSYDASYFVNGDASGYDHPDAESCQDWHERGNADAVLEALAAKGYEIRDAGDRTHFGTPDVDIVLGAWPARDGRWLAGDVITYIAHRVEPDPGSMRSQCQDCYTDMQDCKKCGRPKVRVMFRTWRDDHPEVEEWARGSVDAIFPDFRDNERTSDDLVCYSHVGQHGSCLATFPGDPRVRKATPEEYADLLAELRTIYEDDPEDPVILVVTEG